jgi:hypothetical protein
MGPSVDRLFAAIEQGTAKLIATFLVRERVINSLHYLQQIAAALEIVVPLTF